MFVKLIKLNFLIFFNLVLEIRSKTRSKNFSHISIKICKFWSNIKHVQLDKKLKQILKTICK